MKVLWARSGKVEIRNGALYADTASIRYRILIPADMLYELNVESDLFHPQEQTHPSAHDGVGEYDVLVVSKPVYTSTIDLVLTAKHAGVATVMDICDNRFDIEKERAIIVELASYVDVITVSTMKMAELVKRYTNRDAIVVSDPIEGLKRRPRFSPSGVLKLLWFGHASNVTALTDFVPALIPLSEEFPLELNIVTAGLASIEEDLEKWKPKLGKNFTVRYSTWNYDQMPSYFEQCDIVIIPSTNNDNRSVKSPNRLFESIWAGKFAVAHPVPSYDELSPFAWVDDDLVKGIKWAATHQADVYSALHKGQKYVEKWFSPEKIAGEWKSAFERARACRRIQDARVTGSKIRLNLGCGDKTLDGYINIDVSESRNGVKPDILADLSDLSFIEDNSVDEILSVHVVEHFWRWEVESVLREWMRILKPGGKLIIECPNLLSACEEFVRDPDRMSGPGSEGQRTMWVFYGDPQWKDPLMVHRWGYTPLSLMKLLESLGLQRVHQAPAEYKLKEPRDMRIAAIK